jgi:hypothetical protein
MYIGFSHEVWCSKYHNADIPDDVLGDVLVEDFI